MSGDSSRMREQLVGALGDVQRQSQRELPEIRDDTIPFEDLPGFDSVAGVEAEVHLSTRLGIEVDKIRFVSLRDGRRLSIREIAEDLEREYGRRKSSGDLSVSVPQGSTEQRRARTP